MALEWRFVGGWIVALEWRFVGGPIVAAEMVCLLGATFPNHKYT